MEIINKVAQSGLITIDLEEWYPKEEITEIDLKQVLFQEVILREKDLREFVSSLVPSKYNNKNVCVFCSADAIIPTWAFMLVAIQLADVAKQIVLGSKSDFLQVYYHDIINSINATDYIDSKIVIKGCSKVNVPNSAYLEISVKLKPFAKSIMYGEPCSTVPLYKKPKI